MSENEILWVKSGDGTPIHLTDPATPHPEIPGEYFSIDIDKRMVEEDIAVPVPASPFVAKFLQLVVKHPTSKEDTTKLIAVNEVKAKPAYEAFMKKLESERKPKAAPKTAKPKTSTEGNKK